jgi:hypothetical protein
LLFDIRIRINVSRWSPIWIIYYIFVLVDTYILSSHILDIYRYLVPCREKITKRKSRGEKITPDENPASKNHARRKSREILTFQNSKLDRFRSLKSMIHYCDNNNQKNVFSHSHSVSGFILLLVHCRYISGYTATLLYTMHIHRVYTIQFTCIYIIIHVDVGHKPISCL